VHLAAGVTCSNLRLDQSEVPVQLPDGSRCGSGLRKLGALVGDAAEVGCNSVLNPGSILGRRSLVMPSMAFRGYLKANSIASIKEKIATAARVDWVNSTCPTNRRRLWVRLDCWRLRQLQPLSSRQCYVRRWRCNSRGAQHYVRFRYQLVSRRSCKHLQQSH